jgi:hypothetical protein
MHAASLSPPPIALRPTWCLDLPVNQELSHLPRLCSNLLQQG